MELRIGFKLQDAKLPHWYAQEIDPSAVGDDVLTHRFLNSVYPDTPMAVYGLAETRRVHGEDCYLTIEELKSQLMDIMLNRELTISFFNKEAEVIFGALDDYEEFCLKGAL